MNTGWKVTVLGVLIVGAGIALRIGAGAAAPSFPQSTLTIDTADGQHHKFAVQVARTRQQTEYGLMFRTQIADDTGMIFIWDKPFKITMWMKNTQIPLDMIFLDPAGTVTHVAPDAKPQSLDIISSITPAMAVIEVNAGTAKKYGIVAGDKVESKDLADTQPAP